MRALRAVKLPPETQQPGGHAAHAALQEDVGEGARFARSHASLLDHFGGDGGVALHHVARNILVAVIRGVGHHLPAVGARQPRGLGHRIVVVAGNAHDLRAVRGNGVLAFLADVRVQHDHAAAAGRARRGGQRAAVVAVGGADHGVALQWRGITAGQHARGLEIGVQAQHLAHQRHRRAQRLEAAQRRAHGFVLDADARHPQLPRQAGQVVQRRGGAGDLRPGGQPAPALLRALDVHDRTQLGGVRRANGVWVGDQHGGLVEKSLAPW